MISAYIEWLIDKEIGIIRVGHETRKYGDSFQAAMVLIIKNHEAVIKALTASVRITLAGYRIVERLVMDETGLKPNWERF